MKDDEERFGTIGRSNTGRLICVIYTERGNRIRPISARPARTDECAFYREANS